ncbi:helix-turn-helix domain-containing protein [Nocardia huaxiensis]|uniref:AraC family transcriptional regulator n=1 Tax=Nocardia huaxiensis TaxID=2755382 RepID=A0A7D6VAM8_9NOCA|nr:helix-turn-helix domain-containing protein [Nocardia huaxiensis]QLY30531.1 AraC family transcriptional regulator [Nocardia huaxiensis]UFS95867.1 AraC family transcriptional regulator [Nocardia huaxiensis]
MVEQVELNSAAEVPAAEKFDQWEAHLSDFYVPLAVSPKPQDDFHGWIRRGRYGDVEVSALGSGAQHVRRTRSLIARTDDEFLTATIQTKGHGRLYQDDRVAEVRPGTMVFYDSTRPYAFDLDTDWGMSVVQVPLSRLRERTGLTGADLPTAIAIPDTGAAGVIARFFRDLTELQRTAPEQARLLSAPALDLLVSAVRLAAGEAPPPRSADAYARERVLEYMRRHCTDPELTAERIAQGCAMSRRALYRIFDGFQEGPVAVLRRMRVNLAAELLVRDPLLPVSAVAHACGFATERQLYRSFRDEKGTTPSVFRKSAHPVTR